MMHKETIKKLRDNAELAQAAYGYFDLIGKKFKDRQDEQGEALIITQTDILDITYNGYKVKNTGWIFDDELKGDFAPTQAKRFFERYELIHHIPNTTISGFSATLFYDDYTKAYTLAFRGTKSIKETA